MEERLLAHLELRVPSSRCKPGLFRCDGRPSSKRSILSGKRRGRAAPKVALINETLSKLCFKNQIPLGRRIRFQRRESHGFGLADNRRGRGRRED